MDTTILINNLMQSARRLVDSDKTAFRETHRGHLRRDLEVLERHYERRIESYVEPEGEALLLEG